MLLHALVGSEQAANPIELARLAVEARRTWPDAEECLYASFDFLAGIVSGEPQSLTGDDRVRFHDAYARVLSRGLIDERGLGAYSWLMANRWYAGDEHGIAYAVAHRMRTEANVAFGEWYRNSRTARRREYVGLVEDEAGVNGHQPFLARENALFLIKHSVPQPARKHGYLEAVFSKAVHVLSRDREIRRELRGEIERLEEMLKRNYR